MSIIYYHHMHPVGDLSHYVKLNSNVPIERDLDKSGYYSDRIYHSRNSGARFYIVTFGYEKGWPRSTEPRTINRYTIHFVFDGKGKFNDTLISKGDIFIAPQNVCHVIHHDREEPLTLGWVALSGKELELMLDILHLPYDTAATLNAKQIEKIEEIFIDTIYREHPDEELPFFMFSRFFRVLSLAKIFYVQPVHSDNAYIDYAMSYINTNYAKDISVAKIAEELHISPSHLRSLFADEFGYSPQEAIIKKRMAVAMALFRSESPPSVQTVANIVGYTDQGAFSKRFKRETGYSPLEYLKRLGN